MSRTPQRLSPWPSEADWTRIARQPSRWAPVAAEVLSASRARPPEPCPDLATALHRYSARDLIFEQNQLVGLSLTGRAFLAGAADLFHHAPIRSLRLIAIGPILEEVLCSPGFQHLHELDLSGNRLGEPGIQLLIERLVAPGLQALNLSRNNLSAHALHRLSESSFFGQLRRLNLSDNPLSLVDLPSCPSPLRDLELCKLSSRSVDLARWLTRPDLVRLEVLRLSECGLSPHPPLDLVPAGWKVLDLSFNQLGYWPALAQAPQLEQLDLAGNRLRDGDLTALAHHRFPRLETLNLAANYLTEASAPILTDRTLFPELRSLHR